MWDGVLCGIYYVFNNVCRDRSVIQYESCAWCYLFGQFLGYRVSCSMDAQMVTLSVLYFKIPTRQTPSPKSRRMSLFLDIRLLTSLCRGVNCYIGHSQSFRLYHSFLIVALLCETGHQRFDAPVLIYQKRIVLKRCVPHTLPILKNWLLNKSVYSPNIR